MLLPLIPYSVILDLLFPPARVGSWRNEVQRASMPEAAVNENTDPRGAEDDVGFAAETALWTRMNTVSQARPVQGPAKRRFGMCVFGCHRLHGSTDRR
jgi:hypothetical protein